MKTGTVVTYGIVLPGDQVEGGVPYVRGQDIEDGRILVEQLARTSPEIAARHDRSSLLEGDVLLCIIRHLKVAIVPTGMDGANLTQGTVRLRPSEAILGPYLAGFLAGPTAQGWMKKRYFGMAMPRINVEDARAIPIPVAPLEEQREIIRQIEVSDQRQQAAVAAVNQALDEMNNLDQSILAKAFRGELVSQDPADEPAAVLLARVRSGSTTTLTTPTRLAKRGQVKAYILLLLRTWSKPLGREMLERGLVLMLNADVRRAILGRSKTSAKRMKKSSTPPQFVSGMDALLGEMIDDRWLVPGPEAGFFAEGQHGIDLTAAPPADLDAVRETAEAMKVLHKDRQQATDADIMSALNGEIYELVY